MATLREIRRRISSVKSTQQITKAMKMVAAAKLRRAQENILAIRPYAYDMRDLIAHLMQISEKDEIKGLELLKRRPVERVLLVVVTADRGLCGAFNGNIIRKTLDRIKELSGTEYELYTIGRKATEFFGKRNYTLFNKKLNFFNNLSFEDALEISRTLITSYTSGKFDRVEIIYNEFKSAIQQNLMNEQFLPFIAEQEENESGKLQQTDYIYEPDINSILETVIPKHLNVQIWRVLLESNAAEQGARMTAMENATENAEEIKSKLTLHYNRARQAAITKELSEIVGGAEALKES
ncbi:MAG: ATP synthase F1 subunit gamma [Calditrichaeota bacterium]|nr:ATP synthase F1 subunit gamma [Calditrichota bacterium]